MRNVLQDYLDEHSFRVVVKKKKNYLTYEGLQDRYVYILKSGIIKTSVISKDGREFNLRYINNLEIVSLLRDEYSEFIDAPFNIRIESPLAEVIPQKCAISSLVTTKSIKIPSSVSTPNESYIS